VPEASDKPSAAAIKVTIVERPPLTLPEAVEEVASALSDLVDIALALRDVAGGLHAIAEAVRHNSEGSAR
jgi:hypothetical protein